MAEYGYTSLEDAPTPEPPVSDEAGNWCPVCEAPLTTVHTLNGCTRHGMPAYHCECCHYVWADL